jgi:hypothetical protein
MGIVPKYINIVDQYIKESPSITGENLRITSSPLLEKTLNDSHFRGYLQELEGYLKILNSVVVLVQYNQNMSGFTFDTLHYGNMMFVENFDGIVELCYRVGEYTDTVQNKTYSMWRLWAIDKIFDIVESNDEITSINEYENSYGKIPYVHFYNNAIPYRHRFSKPHVDLINMMDTYNVHLTHISFASKWNKFATLFTNGKLPENYVIAPNSVVEIEQFDKEVFLEFKSPKVDLKSEYEMIRDVLDKFYEKHFIASGTANIKSGIQLYLYDKRLKRMLADTAHIFKTCCNNLVNEVTRQMEMFGVGSGQTFELDIKFDDYIDPESHERMWTDRIDNDRASVIDYLKATQQLSETDAEAKYKEILSLKRLANTN